MKKIISSKNKIIISMFGIIILFVLFSSKQLYKPLEELDICNAIGFDIEKDVNGNVLYSIPLDVYIYNDYKKSGTIVHYGVGRTIADTRLDRQRRSNKGFLLGSERVDIIGEDMAIYGLDMVTNALFSNPSINDNHITVVFAGKAKDIMEYQSEEFSSTGEFLESLIENMQNYSFFSDNYNGTDLIVRQKAEGRNICLPYVVISNNMLQVDGIAIFKGSRMIGKLDMKDAIILNILREKNVKGALSLIETSDKNISYEGRTRRKVKCNKNKDTGKYEYTINIKLNGIVISNSLYKDLIKDTKEQTKFKEDIEKDIEGKCYGFIEKMQKEYKTDLLELGMFGAAKYGRNKENNWDDIVSNSIIKVNVKANIDLIGRGQY